MPHLLQIHTSRYAEHFKQTILNKRQNTTIPLKYTELGILVEILQDELLKTACIDINQRHMPGLGGIKWHTLHSIASEKVFGPLSHHSTITISDYSSLEECYTRLAGECFEAVNALPLDSGRS